MTYKQRRRVVAARELKPGDVFVESAQNTARVLGIGRKGSYVFLACRYTWQPDREPVWTVDLPFTQPVTKVTNWPTSTQPKGKS